MHRLLLVDFDGTLFNSDLFHKDIASYLNSTYKLPFESFSESFEQAKKDGQPHSLKKQLNIVGFRNVNGLIKEIKLHLLEDGSKYIYFDTLDFIQKFKKEMVVYTYAEADYYKYKLAITGLNKHRLPVLAVKEDKNNYLKKNIDLIKSIRGKHAEKIIWIDDKPNVFKQAIQDVDFIRVIRKNSKYAAQNSPDGVKEISTILDVK